MEIVYAFDCFPNLIIKCDGVCCLKEFIGLLRKDLTSGIPSAFKPKPPSQVPILAANIIMCVLQHDRNWPESVAKVRI